LIDKEFREWTEKSHKVKSALDAKKTKKDFNRFKAKIDYWKETKDQREK